MTIPEHPRLRRLENFPVNQENGEVMFALRDPEGFATSVVLPYAAAVMASMMDGTRSLAELQEEFQEKSGQDVEMADIEQLVADLDERLLLDSDRFRALWKREVETYLNSKVRPAAHAGTAYPSDSEQLRQTLDKLMAIEDTAPPGPAGATLVGMMCPHIDLNRGASSYASAYRRVRAEGAADLFVILGTCHNPMRNQFSVTRKDFSTPLGIVETDREFAAKLERQFASRVKDVNLAADELAHRQEHSIEFQTLLLQYLFAGVRPFKIVPILVGAFHEFIATKESPSGSPMIEAFVAALRQTIREFKGRVLVIDSADLAHIGQRFGDAAFLNTERLSELAETDKSLLAAACKPDAEELFRQVAQAGDRDRVCGLSPTYTLLRVLEPTQGQLLRYGQAIEKDGTACVSFASAAFY